MLLCCVQGFVGHHLCHRTKGKRNRNRIYKAVINACNAEILFFFFLQRQCSVLIDDTVNNKLIHSLAELLKKKKENRVASISSNSIYNHCFINHTLNKLSAHFNLGTISAAAVLLTLGCISDHYIGSYS